MQKKLGIMKRAAFTLLCAAGCLGLLTATSAVFFFALGDSGAPEEKRRPCKEAVAVPVCRRPNSACRRLTAATVALL